MRSSTFLLAISALTSLINAQTSGPSGLTGACATIQQDQNTWLLQGYTLPSSHTPSVLWACLKSVPINQTDANNLLQLAQEHYPIISTLGWLKSPPASWTRGAVDFLGAIGDLSTRVNGTSSDAFASEVDFEYAALNLSISTRDFHNNFDIGVLGQGYHTFTFPYNPVALSIDGTAVPKIYLFEDVMSPGSVSGNQSQPSALQSIQGQDPVAYLRNYTQRNLGAGYIEEHAEWNTMMASWSSIVLGGSTTFNASKIHNGDSLDLQFENDIRNATSVEDLYNGLALVAPTATSISVPEPEQTGEADRSDVLFRVPDRHKKPSVSKADQPAQISLGGSYPTPQIVQDQLGLGGWMTGYNLQDQKLGVFSLPGFSSDDRSEKFSANMSTFSAAIQSFIQTSKTNGVEKVIIDLQGNGGGSIIYAYELFKNFFPEITPYGGSSMRENSIDNVLFLAFTTINGNGSLASQIPGSPQSSFNLFSTLTPSGQEVTSWDQVKGPITAPGIEDQFTETVHYNLSNSTSMSYLSGGPNSTDGLHDVYGYGARTTTATRPWDASNIILLTDGTCGSTCAIFAEFMKTEAGVRRVVMGGLPDVGGTMQAVSGSRGSEVLKIKDIVPQAIGVRTYGPQFGLDVSALGPNETSPRLYTNTRVNLRNQIRQQSTTPVQFLYEAADCRLWYTLPMLTNMTAVWTAAANAVWSSSGNCVPGSTGQSTAAPNVTSTDAPSNGTGTGTVSAPSSTSSPGSPGSTGDPKSLAPPALAANGLSAVLVALFALALM